MGSVYLDRYTIKFCDYPFFLIYHNPECGIPAIVSNTMGNCHKRTGCGGDILNMDGDCNTGGCIAVCCDPERLVGKSKDCTTMRDTTRIFLSGTVHYYTCIAVICFGYLYAQQSGKFAVVKCRYLSELWGSTTICLIIC